MITSIAYVLWKKERLLWKELKARAKCCGGAERGFWGISDGPASCCRSFSMRARIWRAWAPPARSRNCAPTWGRSWQLRLSGESTPRARRCAPLPSAALVSARVSRMTFRRNIWGFYLAVALTLVGAMVGAVPAPGGSGWIDAWCWLRFNTWRPRPPPSAMQSGGKMDKRTPGDVRAPQEQLLRPAHAEQHLRIHPHHGARAHVGSRHRCSCSFLHLAGHSRWRVLWITSRMGR